MRIEHSVATVSWIPSDMLAGMGRLGTALHVAHNDPPPPDTLGPDVDAALDRLRTEDRLRFANHLRVFVEVDDEGVITEYGHLGAGVIGSTRVAFGVGSVTVPAVLLPDRRPEPVVGDGWVRFTQTVGGRTGVPMPRAVHRPPFVQYRAPIVWTTLELTVYADGRHEWRLAGASAFPRHWVYEAGTLVAKSSVADYKDWAANAFGDHTPWGDEDSPALVAAVETALERELSRVIMGGSARPRRVDLEPGDTLVEQGQQDDRLFLLLNGVLVVEVDGKALGEIGPGAVLGERAVLEGGRRTATMRAVTGCRVASVPADRIDRDKLATLAGGHRREERQPT
jgi:Cyclic nucleotide-binding domain